MFLNQPGGNHTFTVYLKPTKTSLHSSAGMPGTIHPCHVCNPSHSTIWGTNWSKTHLHICSISFQFLASDDPRWMLFSKEMFETTDNLHACDPLSHTRQELPSPPHSCSSSVCHACQTQSNGSNVSHQKYTWWDSAARYVEQLTSATSSSQQFFTVSGTDG